MPFNPCLRCGACCAGFRVSFHWSECDDATLDGVPLELAADLTAFRRAMHGTNQAQPHCAALQGEVGRLVACSIYAHRPSTCRGFLPSFENGQANARCDDVRLKHGLPPLRPEDWGGKGEAPEPTEPDHPPHKFRPAA